MVARDLAWAAAFHDDGVDDVATGPDMGHLPIWWPETISYDVADPWGELSHRADQILNSQP
jgi:hypothetical protein